MAYATDSDFLHTGEPHHHHQIEYTFNTSVWHHVEPRAGTRSLQPPFSIGRAYSLSKGHPALYMGTKEEIMKARIALATAGLALLITTPAFADNYAHFDHAKVIDSQPVYEIVRVSSPETRCREHYARDRTVPRSYTSVVTGGIIGGVIGNQVVHGKYRDWGTVAGALLGGSLGNDYYQRHQGPYASGGAEKRCREIDRVREERQLAGYEVTYRYHGRDYVTMMDHDPGRRVRVAVSVDVAE